VASGPLAARRRYVPVWAVAGGQAWAVRGGQVSAVGGGQVWAASGGMLSGTAREV
jgi:hypothetical protein